MVGGITLFFAALGKIPGGWGALVAASPERMHLYQPPGHEMAPFAGMIIATFGGFTFYQVGNQAMIQRMLAARSTWDALMGLVLAQFINFLRPLVTCFLGLVVYHWIYVMHNAPPLPKSDLAFTFALREFAPAWGVRGVVVAGLIAAVMAALSAQVEFRLHPVLDRHLQETDPQGGHRPRNGPRRGESPPSSSCFRRRPSRRSWDSSASSSSSSSRITAIAIPFMATVLMGILWKRVNYAAGLFGLLGGVVITASLLAHLQRLLGGDSRLHFFYIGGIAEVVIMIGIALVALMTAPPD